MLKEKVEELLKKNEQGDSKKKIENLVAFLIIIIITIIVINIILKDDSNIEETNTSYKELAEIDNDESLDDGLETRLENILKRISGVGDVDVLITYSESNKVVAMYNENSKESTTEEEDTGGGKRTIQELDTSRDIVYKEENGSKVPITEKIIMPKMEGAIIIAEGANRANVKTNIIQAVEAVTGLATHKIQVFEMKTN